MDDAGDEGLKSNEKVYPASEVKKLKARIAELERALGRKTVDNEILTYAVELAVEKKLITPAQLAKLRGGQ
jgi:transposase